jgi:hypothetical protein
MEITRPRSNPCYVKTDKLPNGKRQIFYNSPFSAVGVTPENKYWLYVDKENHLIQWAYYKL